MIRYLLSRIGCLFLIAGTIILILGAGAIRSGQPGFDLFLVGLGVFFFGFILWNRWRSKERRSTRFSKFRMKPKRDDNNAEEKDRRWEGRFDE
jgi:hypothetical protein